VRAFERSGRLLLVLGLAVAACSSGGAEIPDGFQVVEHPHGSVALPSDWELAADAPLIEDVDPEAVRYQIPGLPEELQIGGTVFAVPIAPGTSESAAIQYSRPMVSLPGSEQTRREPIDVAGTDDATIIEVRAPSPPLDGREVRGTYVAATAEEGISLVVRLLGPTDVLTDELVDDIIGSIDVSGG
jgi:hypothetical protein